MVAKESTEDGAAHDQTHRRYQFYLRVYLHRLDDSGNVDFLPDGERRSATAGASGFDVGNGAGAAAAVGELFCEAAENRGGGRERTEGAKDGNERSAGVRAARFQPDCRGFSYRLPAEGAVVVQHVPGGIRRAVYVSKSERGGASAHGASAIAGKAGGVRRRGNLGGWKGFAARLRRKRRDGAGSRGAQRAGDGEDGVPVAGPGQLELQVFQRRRCGAHKGLSSSGPDGLRRV